MACDSCYHCCFLSIGAMNEITDHIMTSSPRLAFFSRQTPYSGLLLDTISLTSPQGHPHNMDSTLSNSQVRINHAQSMQLTDRIIIGYVQIQHKSPTQPQSHKDFSNPPYQTPKIDHAQRPTGPTPLPGLHLDPNPKIAMQLQKHNNPLPTRKQQRNMVYRKQQNPKRNNPSHSQPPPNPNSNPNSNYKTKSKP